MKNFSSIAFTLFVISTHFLWAESTKTQYRHAYQQQLTAAVSAEAAAVAASTTGHKNLADMLHMTAVATTISAFQNYQNYKKFKSPKDGLGPDDFRNFLNANGLGSLDAFKGSNKGGNTTGKDNKEGKENLSNLGNNPDAGEGVWDPIKQEEIKDSKLFDDVPDQKGEESSGGKMTSSGFGYMASSSGGGSQESEFDLSSMMASFLGGEKDKNPDYIGNVPTRLLAQDNSAETIWDRISKTTRKHLK